MLTFSKSEVNSFQHRNTYLRWGQAFYQHFKLHRVTNPADKYFCDKLYNADETTAKAMVTSRIDHEN